MFFLPLHIFSKNNWGHIRFVRWFQPQPPTSSQLGPEQKGTIDFVWSSSSLCFFRMVVIEQCCCCSVRTACIIFGGIALLSHLGMMSDSTKNMIHGLTLNEHQLEEEVDNFFNENNQWPITRDDIRYFFKITVYMSIPNFPLSIAVVISSICLLHGVRIKKPKLFLPIMFVLILDLIIRIVFVCILVVEFGFFNPLSIAILFVFLFGIALDGFGGLCIYSHWQQLKEEEENNCIRNNPVSAAPVTYQNVPSKVWKQELFPVHCDVIDFILPLKKFFWHQ